MQVDCTQLSEKLHLNHESIAVKRHDNQVNSYQRKHLTEGLVHYYPDSEHGAMSADRVLEK